jgi:hypothetical protein
MENALLYTFSTIAQALGGAFALLAAFVLYRFQSLDPMMAHYSAQVRGGLSRGGGDLGLFDSLSVQGNSRALMYILHEVASHFTLDAVSDIETLQQLNRELAGPISPDPNS